MKKSIKLAAALLALVMVMGVVVSCDIPFIDEMGNFNGLQDILNIFSGEDNVLVATSQNFEVYSGAAKCFFMNNFNGFSKTYLVFSSSVFNFDGNAPLGEQYITTGSMESNMLGYSGTWLGYFVNETMNDINETLALCEYALAHGMKVNVDDSQVAATLSSLSSSYSCVSHIGVNEDTVRDYLELVNLADVARKRISENIEKGLTEDEILAYAENNKTESDCIDVVVYEFHVYSQDFESEAEYQAQLDNSMQHMREVCAATTPEEFVRIMDGKSDDVADYLKKGYTRKDFTADAADTLFNGGIGTTAISQVTKESGSGTVTTFTAYMRCSESYTARSRNYYYAVFSDEKVAGDMIKELSSLGKYDFPEFRELASRYGATIVEFKENQVKSTLYYSSAKDKVIYEYNYGVSVPNDKNAETDKYYAYDEETETCVEEWDTEWETELYDELPSDYYDNYYSDGRVGDSAITYKDYYYAAESGDLKFDYNYSVNTDGTNPGYTIVVPGDGFTTIKPGEGNFYISGIFNSALSNGAVDNWVFDADRKEGDITETPVAVSGGYAVMVYSGEGVECYIAEAKGKLVEEKLQVEIDKAKAKVSVSYEENLEELLAAPKSSGFLGF